MGSQTNTTAASGPQSEADGVQAVAIGTTVRSERRAYPRHAVDCAATLTVISGAGVIAGQMLDLGRGGCRLATRESIEVGILTRVEVRFALRGMTFLLIGVTAGTRTGRSFAVRFLEMPKRRAEELEELLAEIATNPAGPAQAPKAELEPPMARQQAARAEAQKLETEKPAGVQKLPAAEPVKLAAGDGRGNGTAAKGGTPAYRRAHDRHAVDTRVNLTLVRSAITMGGCILDLSQGGCRLRMDERFNVGIHARVEAEFFLHGLPFRLAGVSQAIVDQNTIGVRFLDVSERKREQLAELIAEIEEKVGKIETRE